MLVIKDVTITIEELELLESVLAKESDRPGLNPVLLTFVDKFIDVHASERDKERLQREKNDELSKQAARKDNLAILRGKILQIKRSFQTN